MSGNDSTAINMQPMHGNARSNVQATSAPSSSNSSWCIKTNPSKTNPQYHAHAYFFFFLLVALIVVLLFAVYAD
eukprot:m.210762 g.210762  ORF g.210762 m.210762 type:complete len:74 (-) comp13783_c0_seq1:374-595(-)